MGRRPLATAPSRRGAGRRRGGAALVVEAHHRDGRPVGGDRDGADPVGALEGQRLGREALPRSSSSSVPDPDGASSSMIATRSPPAATPRAATGSVDERAGRGDACEHAAVAEVAADERHDAAGQGRDGRAVGLERDLDRRWAADPSTGTVTIAVRREPEPGAAGDEHERGSVRCSTSPRARVPAGRVPAAGRGSGRPCRWAGGR